MFSVNSLLSSSFHNHQKVLLLNPALVVLLIFFYSFAALVLIRETYEFLLVIDTHLDDFLFLRFYLL
jgi:hypothetical protein